MVRPCKITLLSCMVGALLSIGAVDLGSGEECYMHNAHPSVLDAQYTMHVCICLEMKHTLQDIERVYIHALCLDMSTQLSFTFVN